MPFGILNSKNHDFLCANCRAKRSISMDPHVGGAKHFFQIGIVSAIFTLAAWPLFEWKGLVAFVPIWALFETLYRLKLRSVLTCPYCGFDPILYMRDVKGARAEIEKFWRAKFQEKGVPWPGESPEKKAPGSDTSKPAPNLQGSEDVPADHSP